MKTIKATGKYAVSFNCHFGDGYTCGEESLYTLDHAGDDIDDLAKEVIDGDPNFPMRFVREEEPGDIIGRFYEVDYPYDDEQQPVAVMTVYRLLD